MIRRGDKVKVLINRYGSVDSYKKLLHSGDIITVKCVYKVQLGPSLVECCLYDCNRFDTEIEINGKTRVVHNAMYIPCADVSKIMAFIDVNGINFVANSNAFVRSHLL